MALIEIMTFRLAAGADEPSFLEADRRVQTEFIPRHLGFLRRTTARPTTPEGEWAVIVLWASAADADASRAQAPRHPATQAFDALVDAATVDVRRYETLE